MGHMGHANRNIQEETRRNKTGHQMQKAQKSLGKSCLEPLINRVMKERVSHRGAKNDEIYSFLSVILIDG